MKKRKQYMNTETVKQPDNGSTLLNVKAMKSRTQIFNPHSRRWVKRDEKTGRFCGVKKDGEPWRRVEVEENTPVIALGW